MLKIPITHKNVNLEILTKLLNSVAKKYGCTVEYLADENRMKFSGDMKCCHHVTEEMMALFPKTASKNAFQINCPIDKNVRGTETKYQQ